MIETVIIIVSCALTLISHAILHIRKSKCCGVEVETRRNCERRLLFETDGVEES